MKFASSRLSLRNKDAISPRLHYISFTNSQPKVLLVPFVAKFTMRTEAIDDVFIQMVARMASPSWTSWDIDGIGIALLVLARRRPPTAKKSTLVQQYNTSRNKLIALPELVIPRGVHTNYLSCDHTAPRFPSRFSHPHPCSERSRMRNILIIRSPLSSPSCHLIHLSPPLFFPTLLSSSKFKLKLRNLWIGLRN